MKQKDEDHQHLTITCPDCNGQGDDSNGFSGFLKSGEVGPVENTCEKCEGTGEVPDPNNFGLKNQ